MDEWRHFSTKALEHFFKFVYSTVENLSVFFLDKHTVVPIFVEHWGDNLQFYPNFALFSTLGGMNLDHDFVQVWKFSEDLKKNANRTLWKMQIEHFFSPILKKVFSKNRTLFPPNLRSAVHPFKLLGGCRCGIFSNYWGGYTQIIGGDISPPPVFRHPCKHISHFFIKTVA